MPVPTRFRGVLLRHADGFELKEGALRDLPSATALQVRPHLRSLTRQAAMPTARGKVWSSMGFDSSAHPWDAAHAAVDLAVASGDDEHAYAEPNFEYMMQPDFLARAAVAEKPCEPVDGQRLCMWPPDRVTQPPDWHLDRSGLRNARADAAFNGIEGDPARWRVRIGHLDTGYSETHETVPRGLRRDLARNVLADPPTNDAVDPAVTTAPLSSPGHGTATLGILAGGKCTPVQGKDLGGIPFAEIVPVRMSDYVWHVWTEAIPKAIQWALDQKCDVISMSHGGLATRTWADAINAAYDAGCIVCAASGDNFGGLPIRDVVWPARFRRALAVCGVTYTGTPYFDATYGIGVLEGNWGPADAMNYAIAAYTPNVLWPKCKDKATGAYTVNGYDLDGGGTSASTPQVAAAVALYLQKYGDTLRAMPGWQRVETVRTALFRSAQHGDSKYFGRGLLDATAMLAIDPATIPIGELTNLDADEIRFQLLSRLPGWGDLRPGQQKMLEVEANQIAAMNPWINDTVRAWEAHGHIPQGTELITFLRQFRDVHSPPPSTLLWHLLDDGMHV